MTFPAAIRRPRTTAAKPLTAADVATAYHYPSASGHGVTIGLVELGGGFDPQQFPDVTAVAVGGGSNTPDGPNGADGEVQLDIEVVRAVAPAAAVRVYFAANTDAGFLAACKQACGECDVVSISWGGPESSWSAATMREFDAVFAAARARGVTVFVAAGDTGADDGTGTPTCDFPASSPNVVSCGGTRLEVTAGERASEVTWNDNSTRSATGGGASRAFPGRDVPDVAGNADPDTGYEVVVDGQSLVIGGTSAVAPLYAGLCALLQDKLGHRVPDFLSTVTANPGVCYDVTAGDNGAFRAGPGRDQVTGFGVADGTKLLVVMQAAAPVQPPSTPPTGSLADAVRTLIAGIPADWLAERHVGGNHAVQVKLEAFLADPAVAEAAR